MRPDDEGVVPFDGIGADPALDALAAELAEAGGRARADRTHAPRAAFAADLRTRLLSDLPRLTPVAAPPMERARPGTPAAEPFAARRVMPRITGHTPTLLPAPRWSVLAVAAGIMVALIGLGPSRLLEPPADLRAGDVASATLTRDGLLRDLTSSEVLQAGDVIATATGGRATLELGANRARLDGGATVRIVEASVTRVDLDQTAGRIWHRVGGPAVTYSVHTGDVTWTADGTAFDLRLDTDPANEDVWARGIGIEHDVSITGPRVSATLDEGAVARIRLDGAADSVTDATLGPIAEADLHDPWLLANAARDSRLGFAVGVLEDRLAEIAPTPSPTSDGVDLPTPTDAPISEPPASEATPAPGGPEPTAIATPTPKPTPHPTAKPTATPKPSMATLGSGAVACDGGFTRLTWTMAPKSGFGHYQTIRSSKSSIPAVSPPVAPAVAPDGLYAGDRATLAAADGGLETGATYSYRTMAFGGDDIATAASSVRTVTARPVKALGALAVAAAGAGFSADWTAYLGPDGCFGFYKLVVSTTDATPSYLEGASAAWVGETAATSTALVEAIDPGTYHVRLQVFFEMGGTKRLVAESDVSDVTIP